MCFLYLLFSTSLMLPVPRYLDLQSELGSAITLHKELIFDNPEDHFHLELFQRVTYDSEQRVIDLTEPIAQVLRKAYGPQECRIYVYDPFVQEFIFLAYFPQQNGITLGEQFLQADTLLFRIRLYPQVFKLDEVEGVQELEGVEELQGVQECQVGAAGVQEKGRRRRTIREMLGVMQQWRKLYLQFNSKLSLSEGAQMIGLSKRNLQFYIQNVRLGEKYAYPFEQNLDKKIGDLKKFLKGKSEQKKNQEMQMLANFKHFYK